MHRPALRLARRNPATGYYDDPPDNLYQYYYDDSTKLITIVKSPKGAGTVVAPGQSGYDAIMGLINRSSPIAAPSAASSALQAAGASSPPAAGGKPGKGEKDGKPGPLSGRNSDGFYGTKYAFLFALPLTVVIGGYFLLRDSAIEEDRKKTRKKKKAPEPVEVEDIEEEEED